MRIESPLQKLNSPRGEELLLRTSQPINLRNINTPEEFGVSIKQNPIKAY